MNASPDHRELPELTNEQIETLYHICLAASKARGSIFAALFAHYHSHFEQNGLDTSRDNTIFRWLFPIGDSARRDKSAGQSVDLVRHLRSVLAAQGIETVLSDEDYNEAGHEETASLRISHTPPRKERNRPDRRVSFDDARLEETWLSEHSELRRASPHLSNQGLLSQPPRRSRDFGQPQRARSTSSSTRYQTRQPAPKHFQQTSPSSPYTSDYGDQRNPTLLFEVSQTQLEQHAEAFFDTTNVRTLRRYLHVWHDQALALQSARGQAWAFAANFDRRKLLKDSLDTLLATLIARREERQRIMDAERLEREAHAREQQRILSLEAKADKLLRVRDGKLVYKGFSHWLEALRYQRRAIEDAKQFLLRMRYFHKWRRITVENVTKARSVLSRKYLKLWRAQKDRRALAEEQATANFQETVTKKYLQYLRLKFRERRLPDLLQERKELGVLHTLQTRMQAVRLQTSKADDFRTRKLLSLGLHRVAEATRAQQQATRLAEDHRGRTALVNCFSALQLRAKLTPRKKTVASKVDLDLKRKALGVWKLHFKLTRQAAEVDRKRILQSAWTSWNDALRCRALGQRMDERVLVESLYKWVLQTRLRDFQRRQNGNLLTRVMSAWHYKLQTREATLEQAATTFAANQRRRTLRSGMVRLNLALRQQEDAERAAVEFANSRTLPSVLDVWKQQTAHARMLAKWAVDARFYCLTTRTIRLWRERTEEHKHSRRRDAYAQVRAKIKLRLVRQCFAKLQDRCAEFRAMQGEAETRASARLFAIGTDAFDKIRGKTAQCQDLKIRAIAMDQEKLLASALSALVNQRADLSAMEQQALVFRQESDLSLLAGALKRVQWVTFTAARRGETADALWARNRDQHIKNMIRHWASRAARLKAAKADEVRRNEVESPSLRPASRAAARSAERPAFNSSPPVASATPAYMRTPSRSRKTGRFKPLPTPAHFTPMAFDPGYFITTPGPLTNARSEREVEDGGEEDVFEGLTPQITPFARKLRAGGISNTPARAPPSALRSSVFGRSTAAGGTAKSVRFAGSSRFGSGKSRMSPTDEST
ncbi:hypothetical protein AC578_8341 [Pseudocercospora eumusae]|uniref:Sfi1 spindle body domain-containing protein n=1 Tax=Pseudocercospora eumusae TaxID=321146 RepID=A0A139HRQ8_9PEZI|nr:hypothetical protein AC578_8341 [Pseudocercospora eumusae]